MPSYVLKRSPEADEYLVYSTVVDAPVTYVMTREEMAEHLAYEQNLPGPNPRLNKEGLADIQARLQRADKWGSSSYARQYGYPWGSREIWWITGNPQGEPGTVTRDELFEQNCHPKEAEDSES